MKDRCEVLPADDTRIILVGYEWRFGLDWVRQRGTNEPGWWWPADWLNNTTRHELVATQVDPFWYMFLRGRFEWESDSVWIERVRLAVSAMIMSLFDRHADRFMLKRSSSLDEEKSSLL
jgi:hypothetical protein